MGKFTKEASLKLIPENTQVQSNKQYHMKSTAQKLSFEWSHTRGSSTDLNVRTTLYSVINSITVLLKSFHLNGHILGFHPQA